LTLRNCLIGYYIVEYEQQGSARYGERLLDHLARDLRRKLGQGFTLRYLEIFRQFYLRYPIAQSLISQFAEYALGGLSNRIFVSRYLPHIPTREELTGFLRRTRRQLER
jgi:hypothetical protein